jgi:outer membrane lipoprotein-sorting protein
MADDKLSGILEGIRKKYGNLPGLNVNYKREILTKSMAMLGEKIETDLATGKFYFKPPHFLRVQQEMPKNEIVTTDGNTLWWYIPQKREVYQYPSLELGKELRLLTEIFHGLKSVGENFDVTLTGYAVKGKHRLKLIPNPPWPEIQHINLSVAQEDYTIKVVEIYNYIGGITRFTLGDVHVQKKFEKGFFRLRIPKGVKVIKGGG